MQVTPSNYTIADYCRQMNADDIIVNRDYQRSDKVWPTTARSYLIDTILMGFPVPKLSLYQKTDLKSRKTLKEIVDGQQRSQAILSFYKDEYSISTKGEFFGKRFSQLSEELQVKFLDYQLSVDLFTAATSADIREVFRRMNSYTVPLNPAEIRNATHQGAFKWFMTSLTDKYSESLKVLKVFSERDLVRMKDATFFTELIMSFYEGNINSSEKKVDYFYKENDKIFNETEIIEKSIDEIFNYIFDWKEIHGTDVITKTYNFFSLTQAIEHCLRPKNCFQKVYTVNNVVKFNRDSLTQNLSFLAQCLQDSQKVDADYSKFILACSSGTNRITQRETRFKFFCKALNPKELMP